MANHRFTSMIRILVLVAILAVTICPMASAESPADARAGTERSVPNRGPTLGDAGPYDCSAQSEIPEAECEALVALYNATNGGAWPMRTNWLINDQPSTWYGVTVEGGHVTRLALPVNLLNGTIPSELGNLTELLALDLNTNQLTGEIPITLGNLVHLTDLNLSYNNLSGAIPTQLGNLTALQKLHLSSNALSGGLPAELGNMAALTNLVLQGNALTGSIPSTLTGLAGLYYVDLSSNAFTGNIPAGLWANPSLAYIVLDGNQLTGEISAGLGSLSQLVHLDLATNQLTGGIPADLSNVTTLEYLNLRANGLTGGVPDSLGSLTSLSMLDLSDNPLGGTIPTSLGSLIALEHLGLANASLTGAIPEQVGALAYLLELDMSANQLSGSLPQTLGALMRVEMLDISDNQLSGEIPGTLGNMVSLQSLDLSHNQLSGGIPSDLSGLSALQSLDLSHNQLSGEPPSIWGGLTSLETLYLNDNALSGAIPSTLSAASGVESLSLANNEFAGDVPASLGDLTLLVDLDLGGNHLTGALPSQLGSLSRLSSLVVRSNMLVGPIPQSVTMLTNLASADLAYNRLSTTDTGIAAFLTSKDPDWSLTQTLAPTNVHVDGVAMTTLQLGWTPIAYTADGGYYEVSLSATPGGPYALADATSSKLDGAIELTGLVPNTTYYVVVRTLTPAHGDQTDALLSEYTSEIAATTSIPVGFDCAYVTEVPCVECEALQALYTGTDGANWERNENWLQTTQISAWEGVIVSEGHVTALSLPSNHLAGALASELSNLAALQALYLDRNALSGEIPAQLGGLSQLVVLNLCANDLAGSIPSDLGTMDALETLQLQQNELAGEIPSALGSLSSLRSLDLSENHLSGSIPPEIGNLTGLRRLLLHANNLTGGVPDSMGNLTSLQSLSLSYNALADDLPVSLVNLTDLGAELFAVVDLGYNRLTASDASLVAFLAQKDPDWQDTQTVAPADLAVDQAYSGSIRLSWTPIAYTGDEGWYQVSVSEQSDGPWTVHGATLSKVQGTYLADGLDSSRRYWFQVRTTTHPHGLQANELWSDPTEAVDGTTTVPALEGFGVPTAWILLYGPAAGGWFEQNIFPRMLDDVNGDGLDDIVAFGNRASYVSLSTGSSFAGPQPWLFGLGVVAGGWVEQNIYPRTTGDVNGDGFADVVAFGNRAVYVSLSDGTSFGAIEPWIAAYGVSAGGWTEQNLMPRHVGDVDGDGLDDIVGFGNSATYVSLSTGEVFTPPEPWIYAYGIQAGGWSDQNTFPRFLGDVNGDGMQDIVAFGDNATYVSLSEGDHFGPVTAWISCYGVTAGGWTEQNIFPRFLGDVNGDGRDDIIACGDRATYVSLSTGAGFGGPMPAVRNYGLTAGGWSDQNTFPRMTGDANGDGQDDLVGFGNRATYVSLADW